MVVKHMDHSIFIKTLLVALAGVRLQLRKSSIWFWTRVNVRSLGLATACLGGETMGSIIDPSSYNNIVGMKPSMCQLNLQMHSALNSYSRWPDVATPCNSYQRTPGYRRPDDENR